MGIKDVCAGGIFIPTPSNKTTFFAKLSTRLLWRHTWGVCLSAVDRRDISERYSKRSQSCCQYCQMTEEGGGGGGVGAGGA